MKHIELKWDHVFDDGETANVRYTRSRFFGRDRLYINEQEIRLPGMLAALLAGGIDVPFSFGGRRLNFVSNDYLIGIAENGIYGKTGIEYVPGQKTAYIFYLFAVVCLLIPLFTLGGSVPTVIGFIGMGVCFTLFKINAFKNLLKNKARIITALLTAVLCWVVTLILFFSGDISFKLFTGPEDKVFSGEGFSITLNEEFKVLENSYYVLSAKYKNSYLYIYKDDYSDCYYCPLNAREEAEIISEYWGISAEIYEKSGSRAVMEFVIEENEHKNYTYIMIYKDGAVFLLFEFYCGSEDKDEYRTLFEKWAETVVMSDGNK